MIGLNLGVIIFDCLDRISVRDAGFDSVGKGLSACLKCFTPPKCSTVVFTTVAALRSLFLVGAIRECMVLCASGTFWGGGGAVGCLMTVLLAFLASHGNWAVFMDFE